MSDHLSEEVARQRKIEEDRRRYEEWEAEQREARRVAAEREEMQRHLEERGKAFQDATGTTPSRETLEKWQVEFLDTRDEKRRQDHERQAAGDQGPF